MKVKDIRPLILWENEDYFVVNKPPFISSLQDRHENINMLKLAKEYVPDAQLAHRLDKETSGALIIAKNEAAYRHISIQFTGREVDKTYHALIEGVHNFDDRVVKAPIQVLSSQNKVRIGKQGKEAVTYFKTLKTYYGYTLVACKPVTGRMHQIRIHLVSLGAVITGDQTYGGKPLYLSSLKKSFNLKKLTEEEPLMRRMALHAAEVAFKDLDGKNIQIKASYPKDFRVLMKQLNKYG
jgi:23S rRNA pseudouridine955/2504/2580 synthase